MNGWLTPDQMPEHLQKSIGKQIVTEKAALYAKNLLLIMLPQILFRFLYFIFGKTVSFTLALLMVSNLSFFLLLAAFYIGVLWNAARTNVYDRILRQQFLWKKGEIAEVFKTKSFRFFARIEEQVFPCSNVFQAGDEVVLIAAVENNTQVFKCFPLDG